MVTRPGSWHKRDARRKGMGSAACGGAAAVQARGWTASRTSWDAARCVWYELPLSLTKRSSSHRV
jgi:hypothetical protein